ncbi:MAG: hypothetical protein HY842_13840 [Bacteroidetes bacterium]|nr:hypothetical protein [Bacteroidota bacterium]
MLSGRFLNSSGKFSAFAGYRHDWEGHYDFVWKKAVRMSLWAAVATIPLSAMSLTWAVMPNICATPNPSPRNFTFH